MKVPPAKVTSPAEVPPSPQSMEAAYSPVASAPPGSVKVATGCKGDAVPSVAPKVTGRTLSTTAGSATLAVAEVALTTADVPWLTWTPMGYDPSSW